MSKKARITIEFDIGNEEHDVPAQTVLDRTIVESSDVIDGFEIYPLMYDYDVASDFFLRNAEIVSKELVTEKKLTNERKAELYNKLLEHFCDRIEGDSALVQALRKIGYTDKEIYTEDLFANEVIFFENFVVNESTIDIKNLNYDIDKDLYSSFCGEWIHKFDEADEEHVFYIYACFDPDNGSITVEATLKEDELLSEFFVYHPDKTEKNIIYTAMDDFCRNNNGLSLLELCGQNLYITPNKEHIKEYGFDYHSHKGYCVDFSDDHRIDRVNENDEQEICEGYYCVVYPAEDPYGKELDSFTLAIGYEIEDDSFESLMKGIKEYIDGMPERKPSLTEKLKDAVNRTTPYIPKEKVKEDREISH